MLVNGILGHGVGSLDSLGAALYICHERVLLQIGTRPDMTFDVARMQNNKQAGHYNGTV